ncbi:MAG: hypothetical protein A2286_03430 [Gammaproteobacteria bacterium RIFOXYA12_FULL_61_12]|nr:MAG: hypothetical protein A2286_03430 [Gammaproteobacteria bacterium RIFOXYA12_FULL_61_12]OGT91287.1 MAG: hypothetical protein A2514_10995 [Gammaproteobacteria bacterium RIFOXYD12_FULL_61_37]
MTPELSQFFLAHLTLEAVTPLSIAAGGADGVFDVTLARDANGLPTLPGPSIGGVLRHLYWELYGKEGMESLFGFQKRDQGEPSRLHFSWGAIQDSKGHLVERLLLGQAGKDRLKDLLLKTALATQDFPVTRDRVRIGHKGAAAHMGKFDRAVLPAGYRFSAEISLWSDQPDDPRWRQVLGLLCHPLFRLGGGTRAGLGRIAAVSIHAGGFDLKTEQGRKDFSALGQGLDKSAGLKKLELNGHSEGSRFLTADLTLKPHSFWRIGQGDNPRLKDSNGKPADLLPKLESCVIWNDQGEGDAGQAELLIPGSSLKGALAHRFAFHANRLAQRWAEDLLPGKPDYDKSTDCEEVANLFGTARDDKTKGDNGPAGQAGKLFIDDAFLSFTGRDLKLMMHNAIDRFTGGVREHMLFMEEMVWKKEIKVSLTLDTKGVTENARTALRHALDDLCHGRIAIGGGAAKGHGFCDGTIQWSDKGQWINHSSQEAA